MSKTEMELLLDLLKEMRADQKEHGKELSKQSVYLEGMDADVKELKQTVSKNTDDIAHHIRRTDSLQDLYAGNQKRIETAEERIDKLEEPVKARAWIKQHIVSILSILTAIGTAVAWLLERK